jgi:3-deoxy-manno-octulosonate cytidylyltransferase (CMP-KDO synthetase)
MRLQESQANQLMSTAGYCQINLEVTPRIVIVIPARLDSQRLPEKALLQFKGLPMIEHVRRRAKLNSHQVPVIVASGDNQILAAIEGFGGEAIRTLENHLNGTSRVYEVSKYLDFTHYLVLQGDELLVLPEQIDSLIQKILDQPQVDFLNLTTEILSYQDILDESVVKCVQDQNDRILFLFRKSPLIGPNPDQLSCIKKICGVFAVSKSALVQICQAESSRLEKSQSIEQLRYLEIGGTIEGLDTTESFPSINLYSDIEKVENALVSNPLQRQILNEILLINDTQ